LNKTKPFENILITGITGFLGSHLAKELVNRGYKVTGLIRSKSNTKRINEVLDLIKICDLDKTPLDRFIWNEKIDCVIHTACLYGRKNESIEDVNYCNITYGLEILESLKKNNRPVIFINTSTVLPPEVSIYSLSKHKFEELAKKITIGSGGRLKFINIRLHNIYGLNDDAEKFINYVIQRCLDNNGVIDLTSGHQKRDYIHVDDAVNAYVRIIEYFEIKEDLLSQDIDVGTGLLISIHDIVKIIHTKLQSTTKLNFGSIPTRKGELLEPSIDLNKITYLGWKPQVTLEDGIKELIQEQISNKK